VASTHEVPPRIGMRLPGSPTRSAIPARFHVLRSLDSPLRDTGVPNKYYRGAHQIWYSVSEASANKIPANKVKIRNTPKEVDESVDYRGRQQGIPGCPTRITGAPDKNYRGARQGLPGSPARDTGVSNKDYRGA
jgi:hypothetical protein